MLLGIPFLLHGPASIFIFNFIYLFNLFIFGCVGSSLWCAGFSLRWLLLLRSTGSRRAGLGSCGLVAPRHVGSSWTRARTRVSYIGRQILSHCATREAPCLHFYLPFTHSLNIYCVHILCPVLGNSLRGTHSLWETDK